MGQREGAQWPLDRQVPRLAFAANAAIMPRNKFVKDGAQRTAKLVKEHVVERPSSTILFTEFRDTSNWRSLSDPEDGDDIIKSHRPITPFIGRSAGANVFDEPDRPQVSFDYPLIEVLESALSTITPTQTSLIVGQGRSQSSLEAVNNIFGGRANFAYLDGHVELRTVLETVEDREWGSRFYSISGNNKVREAQDDL